MVCCCFEGFPSVVTEAEGTSAAAVCTASAAAGCSVYSASFGVGSSLAVRSLQRTSPFRPSSRKTISVPAGSVEQKCCRYSNTCSYDCVRRREGAERCTSVSRFRTRLIRFFAVFIVYFVFLCVCTQAKIRQISGLPNRFGQTRSTNRFQLHVSTQTNDGQTVTLKGERWEPQKTQSFTAFFMERRRRIEGDALAGSNTCMAPVECLHGSRAVQVFHNRHLCLSPSDQIFIEVNDSIVKSLQSHIVKTTYLYPFDIQDFSQFFISVPAISDKNGHCFYIHNTEKHFLPCLCLN